MNAVQSSKKPESAGRKGKAQQKATEKQDALRPSRVRALGNARSSPSGDSSGPDRPHTASPLYPVARLQQSVGNQAVQKGLESGLDLSSMDRLLQLQPIIGNQGVVRRLQTKLKVNTPGDYYEQEADRVAEQVIGMPEAHAPVTPVSSAATGVQRKCSCGGTCAKCQGREDDQHLQMKPAGSGSASLSEAPPIVYDVLSSPGQPLDPVTRAFMEPRFGQDFSSVRVHVDDRAADSAAAIAANAYTRGQHVAFRKGTFNPSSGEGRRLIAHELTHTVQQRSGGAEPSGQSRAREAEANRAANQVLSGETVAPLTQSGLAVARDAVSDAAAIDAQILDIQQQLMMPV
jgi:hypothetical protein